MIYRVTLLGGELRAQQALVDMDPYRPAKYLLVREYGIGQVFKLEGVWSRDKAGRQWATYAKIEDKRVLDIGSVEPTDWEER